ncbi:peptide chain release factor N(5)-glutamine methyltransferase [Planococcus sp. ISL-109]|uniref:peptide chain release factor N(5)-glutamine methyltransferase n=1 Tax=Planococcus sp. ISL-109 TaxID=2819166 RepID=UPI001BE71848|nr:peptide chain release factor N(5)-glutamine methyltransferase [Planococcus sp. ISL-109]MBT2583001.1 peptide chain release factor N(5)-glutamine methyltransferase [Planococcus sp. ISL-109]
MNKVETVTQVAFVYEALEKATTYLKQHGREETQARILLQHELGLDYSGLIAAMRDKIEDCQYKDFWENIEEVIQGVPVQHLTGSEQFYGRTFNVSSSVLIPRPETEELMEETLKLKREIFGKEEVQVADIGTGSGIIAITLKCELPEAEVMATDISEEALFVAERNAEALDADVHFTKGDLAAPLAGRKWDIILSNPPYIAHYEAPSLADTVRDFEPHEALFADSDGLAAYEQLAQQVPALINRPGIIGLEIGSSQGAAVTELFQNALPEARVYCKKDINKHDRMVFCILD